MVCAIDVGAEVVSGDDCFGGAVTSWADVVAITKGVGGTPGDSLVAMGCVFCALVEVVVDVAAAAAAGEMVAAGVIDLLLSSSWIDK